MGKNGKWWGPSDGRYVFSNVVVWILWASLFVKDYFKWELTGDNGGLWATSLIGILFFLYMIWMKGVIRRYNRQNIVPRVAPPVYDEDDEEE